MTIYHFFRRAVERFLISPFSLTQRKGLSLKPGFFQGDKKNTEKFGMLDYWITGLMRKTGEKKKLSF